MATTATAASAAKNNEIVSTVENNTAFGALTLEQKMAAMREKAAQFNKGAKQAIPTDSPAQKVKDAVKAALLPLNVAKAVTALQAYEESQPDNVDLDGTCDVLIKSWKSKVAAIAAPLQAAAEKGENVDLSPLENIAFDLAAVWDATTGQIKWSTLKAPVKYKGILMQIDWSKLSDEVRTKLHSIAIAEEFPIGFLTNLSFDKSSNTVYVKVAGINEKAGTVRLSSKFVQPMVDGYDATQIESYNAVMTELSAMKSEKALKFSAKSFSYPVGILNTNAENPLFAVNAAEATALGNALNAVYGEGATPEAVAAGNAELVKAIAMYLTRVSAQGK